MSNNNSLTAVVQDNNSTIQKENDEPGEVNASYATEDAYTYENITNFDAKSDMIIISDFYTKSEDSFLSSKDTNRTDSDKSLLTRDDGSTDELSSGSFGDKDMTLRTLLGKTPATENRCINLKIKRLADMISADQDNSPSCSNSLDLCQEPLSPDIVIADDCEDTRHIITKDEDGNAKLTTAPLKRKRVNNQLGNFRRKTVKLAKEYRMFMKVSTFLNF